MAPPSGAVETDGIPYNDDAFVSLLDRLVDGGATVGPVSDSARLRDGRDAASDPGRNDDPADADSGLDVVLRHDVDLSPKRALAMAEAEADRGVSATFCVQPATPIYNAGRTETVETLSRIDSLGHEIGVRVDLTARETDEASRGAEREASRGAEREARRGNSRKRVAEAFRRRAASAFDALSRVVDDVAPVVSVRGGSSDIADVTLPDMTNAERARVVDEIVVRSDAGHGWRTRNPLCGAGADELHLTVTPGLWSRTDRGLDSVLSDYRRRSEEDLQRYFDPFDTEP